MAGDSSGRGDFGLDEVDEQILFQLMADARGSTAPQIAETVGVSAGTVRNRIDRLEEAGIIRGYHAHVDFERTDRRLTSLFLCNVPFGDRAQLARAAYEIPGVVSIRVLMDGRRNFQVLAVGETTADLRRIGTTLSEIGVDIEDEMLLEEEVRKPYDQFDPEADIENPFVDRTDPPTREEFVEVTVAPDAPVAGMTVADAKQDDLIETDPLIVSISRGEELITPHGETVIEPGDDVRIFSTNEISERTLQAFTG